MKMWAGENRSIRPSSVLWEWRGAVQVLLAHTKANRGTAPSKNPDLRPGMIDISIIPSDMATAEVARASKPIKGFKATEVKTVLCVLQSSVMWTLVWRRGHSHFSAVINISTVQLTRLPAEPRSQQCVSVLPVCPVLTGSSTGTASARVRPRASLSSARPAPATRRRSSRSSVCSSRRRGSSAGSCWDTWPRRSGRWRAAGSPRRSEKSGDMKERHPPRFAPPPAGSQAGSVTMWSMIPVILNPHRSDWVPPRHLSVFIYTLMDAELLEWVKLPHTADAAPRAASPHLQGIPDSQRHGRVSSKELRCVLCWWKNKTIVLFVDCVVFISYSYLWAWYKRDLTNHHVHVAAETLF